MGEKKPNQMGKDRWIFTFVDSNGDRICPEGDDQKNPQPCSNIGTPYKIAPYKEIDILESNQSTVCPNPPCYFYSWLYN